jgi:hypothetical protein
MKKANNIKQDLSDTRGSERSQMYVQKTPCGRIEEKLLSVYIMTKDYPQLCKNMNSYTQNK